jgi:hypothetical protein
MVKMRKCGYKRLRVVESTLPGAGYGLFLDTPQLKAGSLVTSYEGRRITQQEAEVTTSHYIYEDITREDKLVYVDAEEETSCFGRYINDPREDNKVNAKVMMKGGRLVVMATVDIFEGHEIFIDYGAEYWMDKLEYLSPADAEDVRTIMRRKGVELPPAPGHMTASPVQREELDAQAPAVRKLVVRSRLEQLSDTEREKYVIDNVEQCEELADHLQYLVGRTYFDDENGHQYQVESVEYDENHRAVIAYRRSMSGRTHKYDDAPHLVYGDGGVLQLVELWGIDDGSDRIRWPSTTREWAQAQGKDQQIQDLLAKCVDTNKEYSVGRDTLVAYGEDRVLYRKEETTHVCWQMWVPEQLRELCMTIHHEGSAHPGHWRMLQTTRLHFYWPAMRQEIGTHCAECRGCALRSKYHRQPKIPVQEYPEVCQPPGRIHIDLTGELPTTDGNGSKYILVVKDYHTKFVWLFALKNKDAIAVADQLVTELFCRWGIPEMVVSDRGKEFRNKLLKRIQHIFKVNRISTTPYNPRSNGFVENHNGTLKDQLHHYVESRQMDWDIFLPTVQLMYNTTVNVATSYTPYYLMFGRECNMPAIGDMMTRAGEVLPADADVEGVGRREQTKQEEWLEELVDALSVAWQNTTIRAHGNASRGNRAGRPNGIKFEEYEVGDLFYRKRNRVRTFKSAQEQETYKINLKLQARYEGPYKIVEKVNAVVYVADINGERKRIHAINMKPEARTIRRRLQRPTPGTVQEDVHYIDEV